MIRQLHFHEFLYVTLSRGSILVSDGYAESTHFELAVGENQILTSIGQEDIVFSMKIKYHDLEYIAYTADYMRNIKAYHY